MTVDYADEVTEDQARAIEALVAAEFASRGWEFVECEVIPIDD